MKSMGIDTVVNFPFPTPPDCQSLYKAERILTYLGALRPSNLRNESGQITDLGLAMSLFPLSPRFSKMLVISQQHGCLPYVICIVSALAVGDPFISLDISEDEAETGESSEGPKSNTIKAKETQAYHHSRLVSLNQPLSLFLKNSRFTLLLETTRVIYSNIYQSLGPMSMLMVI